MTDKQTANLRAFSHFDKSLRELVDMEYDLCIYKCSEKNTDMLNCKNSCVTNVLVPFRYNNHLARDDEDNLYRRCLASKLPNIKQEDYVTCTHEIYNDRVRVLSNYFDTVSVRVLNSIHQ